MKTLTQNLKHAILLMLMVAGAGANAQTGDNTYTVKMSKTVDGKKTEKEETVTVKEGQDIDDIVKTMEKDFTKEDHDKNKKIEINIQVKNQNAKGDGKELRREDREIRKEKLREDGNENKRIEKTIIIKEGEPK
jgi:hypothetical protein